MHTNANLSQKMDLWQDLFALPITETYLNKGLHQQLIRDYGDCIRMQKGYHYGRNSATQSL
jgi:hypothetical protein